MATKLIAAEAGVTALGTTEVYKPPAGKAARVRVQFVIQGHATLATTFSLSVGNTKIHELVLPAGGWVQTVGGLSGPGEIRAGTTRPHIGTAAGERPAVIVAPLGQDFILAAGQAVSYAVAGNAAQSATVRVVGVEDDAP